MACESSSALSDALQRVSKAEQQISESTQKFTNKYGIDQTCILQQLHELKASLIEDERQLRFNHEEIHRNNQIIQQSYLQLQEIKCALLLEDPLDAEDFRLMMKKYFEELKIECLTIKKKVTTEELWDRVIAPNYKLSTQQLRNIRNAFVKDLHFALNKNQNKQMRSSLDVSQSFVFGLPNNSDHGIYYSCDWQCDTVRIIRYEFNQHPSLLKQYETSFSIKSKYKTAQDERVLFDDLALSIKTFMMKRFSFDIRKTNVYHIDHDNNIIKIPLEDEDENEYDYRYSMGIHFDFPICKKENINSAVLKEWSNGYNIASAVGKDMVQLLQNALDKYNVPLRVDAHISDVSIGALLAVAFEKSGVRTSLVLKSPLTAAYIEAKRNKEILSVAMSSFNKALPRMPTTDLVMDSYTLNKGKGFADKIISGQYLGELVRLLSLEVFGDKITRYENKTLLTKRWALKSPVVAQILERFDSQNMQQIYRILRMDLGLQEFSANDAKLFVQLCRVMVNRSADLSSTLLLGILEKAQLFSKIKGKELYVLDPQIRRKCIVAMDGDVWKTMPRYHQRMRNTMQKIVNKKIADKIKLITALDGCGKGAPLAIIANNHYIRHQQYLQTQDKYN
eukprot:148053_1